MQIIMPPQNVLKHENAQNVVIRVSPEAVDALDVITDSACYNMKVNRDRDTYCQTVTLRLGKNRITLRAYKEGKIVNEQIRELYLYSAVHHQYRYPPEWFKPLFFHTKEREAACSHCHSMRSNERPGVAFLDVNTSNCYTCHKTVTQEKFAHAPAVNWLCGSCHSGDVGSDNAADAGRSKYLAQEPVNELCFKCHKENKRLWESYKYRHEPLDSGRCNKCHNPHSSPYSKFVRKPVDQICLSCHKEKHIQAKARKGSLCAGTSEGKRCVVCHTPHASSREFFLREHPEPEIIDGPPKREEK